MANGSESIVLGKVLGGTRALRRMTAQSYQSASKKGNVHAPAPSARASLVVRADVFPHLVMPVGPFVAALRSPVVEMMRNAPTRQDLGQSVGGAAVLPRTTAGHEPDVATGVLVEKPGITLVSHIVDRVIKVEVVVIHPVHRVPHVVDARERVAALHVVGMLEEGVGRVKGTERRAQGGDPDARRLALGVDKGENLARHVVIVLGLHPAAM